MRIGVVSVLLGVLAMAGCARYLYPMYTDKDVVFDPQLVGSWRGGVIPGDSLFPVLDDAELSSEQREIMQKARADAEQQPLADFLFFQNSTVTFVERSQDQGYDVTLTVGEEAVAFTAYLADIGAQRLLDLYPQPLDSDGSLLRYIVREHYLPVHSFWKVIGSVNRVRLIQLDMRWLADQIDDRIPETVLQGDEGLFGDPVVITATNDLQTFLLEHGNDPRAFPEEGWRARVIDLQRVN